MWSADDGSNDGIRVALQEGRRVDAGFEATAVGRCEGCVEGWLVGCCEGGVVGCPVGRQEEGSFVSPKNVGRDVKGWGEGLKDGRDVGFENGCLVGCLDG